MSEPKWTPGPWVAQEGTSTGQDVVAPDSPKYRRTVARCGGRPVDREANARLIAAAPELYEALREVVARFQHIANYDDEKQAIRRARAALATARGEQP